MGDLLEARQLRKAYKGTIAVDGIDLRVSAGERVGLLGPNGAGKTTTLLMLLGAITPDSGCDHPGGVHAPPPAQPGHGARRVRGRLPAAP